MRETIWVYLERDGGGISEGSLHGLAFAGSWATASGGCVEGVCVGGDAQPVKGLAGPLAKIYHLAGPSLSEYATRAFGAALHDLLTREKPSLFIFPGSTQGEDLASWLGASTGWGVILGARTVRREGDRLMASRVEFDGKVSVDYELPALPVILTLEEGAIPHGEASISHPGHPEVVELMVPDEPQGSPVRVLKAEVASRTVDLRGAKAIVAVGAGVGGREGFERAQELCQLLGGEVGATRAAVDAGWVSHERQIGQTGVKVKPDLYVACGISGAAQHRVGMMDSGTIVSINIDAHAPIFRFSHYCVEGDARVVLPKLIELLRR
jgi:electron transfer flavoprotein alpha subunit